MIKAVFFDIDGTLVSFKTHRVPESAWRAIRAMRAKGIKVVIASGRSMAEIQDELKEGFDAYVTMNGQFCFDDRDLYRDVCIPAEDVRVIVEQARAGLYDILVMQGDRSFVNHLGERVRAIGEQVGLDYAVGDLDRAYDLPVYQFNVFSDAADEHLFLDKTTGVITTRWNDLFCDVVPAVGGKHLGVAATLERFGIAPEEAVAFGDGENDLTMFGAVGTSVAMGNAWDMVKDRATMVTDPVDEDGVWNACVKLGIV